MDNDWKNWLSDEKGKDLLRIRNAVTVIHEQNEKKEPLAFYTPHGPKHFKMVEDIFHKLIPDDVAVKFLDEEERFYLLSSAWLHDIGIYRSVVSDVWKADLDDNEIRERHHVTSARFIVNSYDECGVDEVDKEFFATLCLYHRRKEDIEKCPTKKSVGVDNKSHNLKLLAAYLRLADSLDIGTYRAPMPAYSICLAYNIPQESKMHWIKSRIISGIFIDPTSHKITVEFIEPKVDDSYSFNASEIINEKLDYIIELVMQDLNEEMNSVKQILISKGISYFNEIVLKKNAEYVSEQTVKDLVEMVANYDILVHPSASRLLEMILLTMANICGFHLFKHENPKKFKSEKNPNVYKIKDELNVFLTKITNELLTSRPCHYGLINLLQKCAKFTTELEESNFDKFIKKINHLYSVHHKYRNNIRMHSAAFLKDQLNEKIINNNRMSYFKVVK